MRIASVPVLGLAGLASSPALWQAWTGALPVDTALTRLLVAVAVVWVALSAIAMMVGQAPQATVEQPATAGDPATDPGPSPSTRPAGGPQ